MCHFITCLTAINSLLWYKVKTINLPPRPQKKKNAAATRWRVNVFDFCVSAFIDNSQRAEWSINKYFTARQSASAVMAGRLGHSGGAERGRPAG